MALVTPARAIRATTTASMDMKWYGLLLHVALPVLLEISVSFMAMLLSPLPRFVAYGSVVRAVWYRGGA